MGKAEVNGGNTSSFALSSSAEAEDRRTVPDEPESDSEADRRGRRGYAIMRSPFHGLVTATAAT